MELAKPRALPSCEYAKVAEGFGLGFLFGAGLLVVFFFLLGRGKKKYSLKLNKRFWITFHVKIAEKVLSAENAEIKY